MPSLIVSPRVEYRISAAFLSLPDSMSPLLKHPFDQIGPFVGRVPGIVVNARKLGVLDIGANSFEGGGHPTRFLDRYRLVRVAMEYPDGKCRNALRNDCIRIGCRGRRKSRILHAAGVAFELRDESANNDEGGKPVRMLRREIPTAVSARGESREINTRPVAIKLLERLIKRRQSPSTTFQLPSRSSIRMALRKDHDRREAFRVKPNGPGKASSCLPNSVAAIVATAVESENHGPTS